MIAHIDFQNPSSICLSCVPRIFMFVQILHVSSTHAMWRSVCVSLSSGSHLIRHDVTQYPYTHAHNMNRYYMWMYSSLEHAVIRWQEHLPRGYWWHPALLTIGLRIGPQILLLSVLCSIAICDLLSWNLWPTRLLQSCSNRVGHNFYYFFRWSQNFIVQYYCILVEYIEQITTVLLCLALTLREYLA